MDLQLIIYPGHEEEVSPQRHDYYEDASYDDGYSPSPPRASGGAYFPATNEFPPPPPPAGYTQTTTSATHINDYPAHPYNPADYVDSPSPNDPYHPPRGRGTGGENVSSSKEAPIGHASPTIFPFSPNHNESEIYTPTPISPQSQNAKTAVYPEGALISLRQEATLKTVLLTILSIRSSKSFPSHPSRLSVS